MNDTTKPDRPTLPRDAFRGQRIPSETSPGPKSVVVTPDYDDRPAAEASTTTTPQRLHPHNVAAPKSPPSTNRAMQSSRKPFDVYGERTSSRPYALRFPDAIDLVLRQIAAEERTHPLRIIDRILHDHLKRIGRLPPTRGA